MNSIFSTQSAANQSFAELAKEKKEGRENKGVEFSNVLGHSSRVQKLAQNGRINDALNALNGENTSIKSYKSLNSFSSELKTSEINSLDTNELNLKELDAMISSFDGNGDAKEAELFLSKMIKQTLQTLDENFFETTALKAYQEDFEIQREDKAKLKKEIVKEAQAFLESTNEVRSESILQSLTSKISNYKEALQTHSINSFFAPIISHFDADTKSEILSALSVLKKQSQSDSLELENGVIMTWSDGQDGLQIAFKTNEDLQEAQKSRQDAKFMRVLLDGLNQSSQKDVKNDLLKTLLQSVE